MKTIFLNANLQRKTYATPKFTVNQVYVEEKLLMEASGGYEGPNLPGEEG